MFGRKKASPPIGRRAPASQRRPQSFSYHANRVEQDFNLGRLQPREQDARRRERLVRFWRQRLSVILMGCLVIGCLLYILHLSLSPQIVPLTSSSNSYFLQPTAVYSQAATQLLQSSWFNGNKVTIDTDNIKQKLQQKFPELSSVSVTLPLMGHRPIIYIAPTTPSVVLQSTGSGYVLDTNGKALIATDHVQAVKSLQLPIVVDQSHLPIIPGQEALPATSVSFITTVVKELSAKGLTVQALSLPPAPYELDVTLQGTGYFVKFNLHDYQDALQQLGTLLAVQKRLASEGTSVSSYIDVRLAGRAYYK